MKNGQEPPAILAVAAGTPMLVDRGRVSLPVGGAGPAGPSCPGVWRSAKPQLARRIYGNGSSFIHLDF